MSDLKTILVAGNSGYAGAVLVRKLLKAGHKVKAPRDFIYRNDIFLGPADMGTICNANLTDIGDDFHDPQKLKRIIIGCDVVVYLEKTVNGNPDHDAFMSLVDNLKFIGIQRVIYVSASSKHNILLVEHFKNRVLDNFTVIMVNVPTACGLKQKLEISVNVFTEYAINRHKIILYGSKQMDAISPRELPDTWYVARNSDILGFYIKGMADLCLYISEQSLKEIQKKTWSHVTTYKIFLSRFYITDKLFQMLRRPYIPFVGCFKFLFCTIKRLFDVSAMMFLVHVWPEQTYRFSTRKCLPPNAMRFNKNDRPVFPFKLIESRTSDMPRMKEANIVLRGSSFDVKQLEELDFPVFLGSFWDPIQTKKDVTYMTGGAKNALRLGKLGLKVIYFEVNTIDYEGNICPKDGNHSRLQYEQFMDGNTCKRIATLENVYCPPKSSSLLWPSTGSGIPAICALSYFAEKINVYGWDFYLESSPLNMNYWQLYFNLYNFKIDILESSRNFFESAMINFYYAYHLSKLPNINICGRLGQLGKHDKLMGKIERVLFNV